MRREDCSGGNPGPRAENGLKRQRLVETMGGRVGGWGRELPGGNGEGKMGSDAWGWGDWVTLLPIHSSGNIN